MTTHRPANSSTDPRVAVRVPAPTVSFWAAKAVSTALGEAASDFSIHVLPPVVAVLAGFVFFVAALAWQLHRRRYVPVSYWLAVAAVGVFGTMAADVLHVALGIPYEITASLYAAVLAAVFVLWWLLERDLSVHDITTPRRELLYWAAVVATFAMGTAAGDLTATGFGIGYLPSLIVFAALILLPLFGYRYLHFGGVFAFWFAYVLTRPLGASAADWLGKSRSAGGLGLHSGWVALLFTVVLAALVAVEIGRRGRAAAASARHREAPAATPANADTAA
ncbi:MAG TPA: hypothetical protein VFQ96_01845 [Microbacteriaceae bacterium]|nr:hypothetical protein [Microbacteriaceae bacterium]